MSSFAALIGTNQGCDGGKANVQYAAGQLARSAINQTTSKLEGLLSTARVERGQYRTAHGELEDRQAALSAGRLKMLAFLTTLTPLSYTQSRGS